ncbi:MAG: lysine--tRNA ligase [Acidobacteriota bacterium]|nr:lysine--tRNA ligase [Acidobacteriota bacterium]
MSIPIIEENDQTQARREHLEALRQLVGNVYPNKFERSQTVEPGREDTITAVVDKFKAFEPKTPEGRPASPEEIEFANRQLNKVTVRVAGRIASPPRVMGKAAFVHLSDGITRLQIYIRRADVKAVSNDAQGGEVDGWELFGLLDHGDFIGVEGYLFITKTGELSIHVQKLQFLAKALLPLPDKMHGLHDAEIRQRQRYVDLIAGSLKHEREEGELTPREVFRRRSKIISEMRRFLENHGYVEVETPMLTAKATGAAARPFETHHNALDIKLYARIAPELYLKRLLVGGFEKVYELNRNFRNEGIDRTHNPEFTMLEFYWAYADVNQMIDFCEEMIRATVFTALGRTHVRYGEHDIDFSQPFARLTMKESVARFTEKQVTDENLMELFEEHVEHRLIHPTFIYDFPKIISPLSKASPSNPSVAERFELFIADIECANGFSELNDPVEQYQRFQEQMSQRERGDEEAMVMDEDYIRALSYGMPPAAGIGIGIDRFVMLLTNSQSIRDVILFPHLRPERKPGEANSAAANSVDTKSAEVKSSSKMPPSGG